MRGGGGSVARVSSDSVFAIITCCLLCNNPSHFSFHLIHLAAVSCVIIHGVPCLRVARLGDLTRGHPRHRVFRVAWSPLQHQIRSYAAKNTR